MNHWRGASRVSSLGSYLELKLSLLVGDRLLQKLGDTVDIY